MTDEVRHFRRGRLSWLEFDHLRKCGVRHGFTQRYGGTSRGAFSSLNFTSRQGDDPVRVRENWRRLEEAAALPPKGWALVSQVHGAAVVKGGEGRAACHDRIECPAADALVTSSRAVTLGILTADCLAVIMAAPDGGSVAAAHAGWKGTLEGVAVKALRAMEGTAPAGVRAGLGPCIGACCYEVGDDIYERFRKKWGMDYARRVFRRQGGWRLDLQAANLVQLLEAGLREEDIAAVPLCTSCRRDLFFSHRRDGERTGRMLAYAVRD
jgi:YfiH family protein